MRTSLETHFCIDGLRGTIEYLNSPVAKTLMSSELILEKKLEAWNEIKSLLLKRFITEVLVTPLVFILNIVHLSVLTREKDLFDKKGGQCKVEGQGGVLDQLKSLFLSYLSYTDDETNFTANEEPKKQRLGDESAEIFLSISSHLLESNGFTLLVEFVEESLEDLLDDIFPDRPFTFIEFCDLLKTFLVRTIQTITVAKEYDRNIT